MNYKFNNINKEIKYTYDADGKITKINGFSYTYDKLNRISKKKIGNNFEVKYSYQNIDDLKTTNFLDSITNGTIYYHYDNNGVAGFEYNNNNYYYVKNAQNNIIGLLDGNLNEIVSYTYDSWGKIISIKNASNEEITDENNVALINPFRYRSYYYDSETNLYYLNSRYYNPDMGRFVNADGIIGSVTVDTEYNLYNYSANNPINMIDSGGENPAVIFLVDGVVALVVGVVAGTVVYYGAKQLTVGVTGIASKAITTTPKQNSKSQKRKEEKSHTVYTLRNSNNKVVYVGRTVNPEDRKRDHSKNIERQHLTFVMERENLTKAQARGLEQLIINSCKTINSGELGANKINGIRWDNPNYENFMNAASIFADEHEVYVGSCGQ